MKIHKQNHIFLICAAFILLSSCASENTAKTEENKAIKASPSSVIPARNIDSGKSKNIGKIEVRDDNVYYVTMWESKSRATYKVVGDLTDEIKKLDGKIIEANGIITHKSKWSGTIEIQSYKIKE